MAISRSCHLCTGDLLTTDVILLVHPQGDYPTLLVVLDPTSLLGRSSVGLFHKLQWIDLLFHLADCGFN
ncbi:hypothetical protein F2Q68_00015389 [Brassica cretica]|nr:hypothetical protein F2Q68_00015389 [Brassica cretica]KAF3583479.1 hypothetical protein F2Q69_00029181 [Brassica cretica]KAF3606079.1 hypothetical protein DY000_02048030 [Brassica cretica]